MLSPFKIAIALITEGLDGAVEQAKKSYNVVDNYNKGYRQQEINNAKNHARDLKRERLEQWDNAIKIAEAEGIGSIISGGPGLLGGLFKKNNNGLKNQQKLMQQAWEYEKEGMGLQYNYGQQVADAEYKRNLQMWKDTNFGAQRAEMEDTEAEIKKDKCIACDEEVRVISE